MARISKPTGNHWQGLLMLGFVAGLWLAVSGCDAEKDTSIDPDTDGETDTDTDFFIDHEIRDDCASMQCAPNGRCEAGGGPPRCVCDDGYRPEYNTCVPVEVPDPSFPEDLSCGSPGTGSLLENLSSQRWYYVANDEWCIAQIRYVFSFREDGAFMRQFEQEIYDQGSPYHGYKLDFGCFTATQPSALRLELNYSFSNSMAPECHPLGGYHQAPCSFTLEQTEAQLFLLADKLDEKQERHLLRPLEDEACLWCDSNEDCCPGPSWVDENGQAICP